MKTLITILMIVRFSIITNAQSCESGKLDPEVAETLGSALTDLSSSPDVSVEEIRDVKIYSPGFPASDLRIIKITPDSIPLQIYNPLHKQGLPIIISYHAGGFVTPVLPFMQYDFWRQAKTYNAIVFAVDYRVAPEHPFPAAVNDAYNAFRYIVSHGAALGGDTSRIVLLGASAGGNLAAVVSQKAKREGLHKKIKLQILNCPSTDDPRNALYHPSYQKYGSGYFLTKAFCEYYIRVYAGNEPATNPDIAPLHGSDFSGLPPALIVTAEFDVLRDEAFDYAEKLRSAGVRVTYKCYSGQIHCLLGLSEGAAALKDLDNLIDVALNEVWMR